MAGDGGPTAGRLVVVALIGAAVAVGAFLVGIPGGGWFFIGAVVGGLISRFIAPGWFGLVVLLGSIALAAALLDMSDGTYGLVVLVVAALVLPAAYGAPLGDIVLGVRRLGVAVALRDRRVQAAIVVAVMVAAAFAWLAIEFSRNPP